MFDDKKIQATEFTPKDLFDMHFWDDSGKNIPEECNGHIEDNYCQILGNVKMRLGKSNFIEPYDFMNHECPTIAPDYKRADKC